MHPRERKRRRTHGVKWESLFRVPGIRVSPEFVSLACIRKAQAEAEA